MNGKTKWTNVVGKTRVSIDQMQSTAFDRESVFVSPTVDFCFRSCFIFLYIFSTPNFDIQSESAKLPPKINNWEPLPNFKCLQLYKKNIQYGSQFVVHVDDNFKACHLDPFARSEYKIQIIASAVFQGYSTCGCSCITHIQIHSNCWWYMTYNFIRVYLSISDSGYSSHRNHKFLVVFWLAKSLVVRQIGRKRHQRTRVA